MRTGEVELSPHYTARLPVLCSVPVVCSVVEYPLGILDSCSGVSECLLHLPAALQKQQKYVRQTEGYYPHFMLVIRPRRK